VLSHHSQATTPQEITNACSLLYRLRFKDSFLGALVISMGLVVHF